METANMTKMIDQWDMFSHNDQTHILPRYDRHPHDPVIGCRCAPERVQHAGADTFIHHAADGRPPFNFEQWDNKQ
jgi:hypothetical protein